MTTAALVFAMIPLLIANGPGAAARFCLGMVIASGMTIGTAFTLFVLPAMYLYLARDHGRDRAPAAAGPAPRGGSPRLDPGGARMAFRPRRAAHASPCPGAVAPSQGSTRMNPDLVGWAASAVLLATLVRQIAKQAHDGGAGVSTWLFIGQATASALFVAYSVLVDNTVFIVTNACLLATAVAGQVVARRARRRGGGHTPSGSTRRQA